VRFEISGIFFSINNCTFSVLAKPLRSDARIVLSNSSLRIVTCANVERIVGAACDIEIMRHFLFKFTSLDSPLGSLETFDFFASGRSP